MNTEGNPNEAHELQLTQLTRQLLSHFPGSTVVQEHESLRVVEIADAEVVVLITYEEIDLRLQSVRWDGPHTPVAETRRWKKLKLAGKTTEELAQLITAAAGARRKQYRICRYCRNSVPPETGSVSSHNP